jgi:hypothetical protein
VSGHDPGLLERILELPADEEGQKAATFARGLVLGALVGAAIAGSTIWQRRHSRTTAATAGRPDSEASVGARVDTRETDASD